MVPLTVNAPFVPALNVNFPRAVWIVQTFPVTGERISARSDRRNADCHPSATHVKCSATFSIS